MASQTAQLLLPDDLEDDAKTGHLPAEDRQAVLSVWRWVRDFVACPHRDLGRDGTVCPFVPGSLHRRTLWFASEHVAGLDVAGVVGLMTGYKQLLLEKAPPGGDDAIYNTIVVVLTDLAAERAGALFTDVLGQLAPSSYEENGLLFGPFYKGNDGTALYNPSFQPFQSPVPFLFVRHTVLTDWKFFLDDDAAINRWARHFGPAGTAALAAELRGLPWRAGGR